MYFCTVLTWSLVPGEQLNQYKNNDCIVSRNDDNNTETGQEYLSMATLHKSPGLILTPSLIRFFFLLHYPSGVITVSLQTINIKPDVVTVRVPVIGG